MTKILLLLFCISLYSLTPTLASAQNNDLNLSQLVELSKFRIPVGKTLQIIGAYSTKSNLNGVELDESCNNVELDIAAEPDQRFYLQCLNIDAPWLHNGGIGTRFHTTRKCYFDGTTLENIRVFLNPQTLTPLHGNSVTLSNYDGSLKGVYLPITTGQAFLTSFLLGSDDGAIGQLIKDGVKSTFTSSKVGTKLTVTLTDGSASGNSSENRTAELTLDASQNYSLTNASIKAYINLNGQKHQHNTDFTVSDYTEVGDQYYPKQASFTESNDGKQITDTEWQLKSATFIDSFPNDPGLPPYSKVRDKRTGLEFSTGEKPALLKAQMQNYVK